MILSYDRELQRQLCKKLQRRELPTCTCSAFWKTKIFSSTSKKFAGVIAVNSEVVRFVPSEFEESKWAENFFF
jgi:hypothetical protein